MESSFYSGFNIAPGEKYEVSTPPDSFWSMKSISLLPDSNTPENGKVVVYVEAPMADSENKQKIAVASLRVETAEIVNVDYSFNCFTPITIYTTGDPIIVSVSGNISSLDPLIVKKL